VKPILIDLLGWPIRAYGAFVGAALVIGMTLVLRCGRRIGLASQSLLDATFAAVVGGLIGGRLMYVIVHAGDFVHDPLGALRVWEGGMMYFGGLVLGVAVGVWTARRKGVPLWPALDCIAPAMGAGQAIGRIACLVAGCCYGQVIEGHWSRFAAWAIVFPIDKNGAGPQGVPLLPTQILQILEGLALWALGTWMFRRRKWDGQAFLVTFGVASVSRFLIEGLRGDAARGFLFPSMFGETISSSRALGIAMIVATLALWVVRTQHLRRGAPMRAAEA
jgi:phosphatidylglycerol:prolipoprotein diacylglycerol transferase